MGSVQETPAKRRRVETGYATCGLAYDSQDDSGDNLFNDVETVATIPHQRPLPRRTTPECDHDSPFSDFETVATIPHQRPLPQRTTPELPSSPSAYVTQPTQIINRETSRLDHSGRKPSILQVPASSPSMMPAVSSLRKGHGGKLANIMAPAGTAFRPPMGVVVDLSDDEGPAYRGGSSDDELQRSLRVDIKPSTFIQSAQRISGNTAKNGASSSANGVARFKEITSGSFYKPFEISKSKGQGSTLSGSVYDSRNRDESHTTSRFTTASKRSADVMANAYGGSSRPAKQIRSSQIIPAKAQPVEEDITLDDIEDYSLRRKIERIQIILPQHSIASCKNALVESKANYDDALEFLISQDTQPGEIDLTVSDNEQSLRQPSKSKKLSSKQQIKAPVQSIQERWTSTQSLSKSTQPLNSSPIVPKPRKRLVQGRKRQPSPVQMKSSPPPSIKTVTPDSDDSDSGLGPEPEEDIEIESKVLSFLNTCSVPDLVDIAAVSDELATTLLSQKPFGNLEQARQTIHVSTTGTKKTSKRAIGDKIVDKCIDMWTGYEAVDNLVRQCEALGKPVAEEMKKWGVDVFGTAKEGELELVSFDRAPGQSGLEASTRDSGIGTPNSLALSADENNDSDGKVMFDQNKDAFFPQPQIMGKGVVMKDYQVVGVNWLYLLFQKNLSCILADDMGLGKTCQVIAFLAHLFEKGIKGPHLVVVPGSTLENWLREFSVFCPNLSVMPYYANQKEREGIRQQIEDNVENLNVIVTTYGMARRKDDNKFLRRLKPVVCVYDEGHTLKNSKSAGYDQLMRIPAKFRLLLTGTPLQNNLSELASLLGFILPSVFREHSESLEYIFSHKAKTKDESHAALLSSQRIARAKSMMTPFVLRRKKHQVLKHLPQKTRRVEYCELSQSQREIYESEKAKAIQVVQERASGKRTSSDTANIMMALRKASIHPLLFRRLYNDKIISKMSKACLGEEEFCQSNVDLVFEDMTVMTDFELHGFSEKYPFTMSEFSLENDEWMDSGKVSKLCDLLTAFKEKGDRVLVFSQFTMVMNILEAVLETLGLRFFRLDGQTKIDERQDMIDQFYEENDITVFLLSTKAGGAGINLACANKVVIFDSSFNPQDDIQAENRAHRVGQKREVEVIRLVTRGTIEEQIHALGETKLALDDRVAGDAGGGVEGDDKKAEKQGAKVVEEMMLRQIKGEEEVKKGAC
ncbi:hypothetical protein MMC22_010183 [Lobaria immixta]|nr:hypothetical protein [Lobaria immixta]